MAWHYRASAGAIALAVVGIFCLTGTAQDSAFPRELHPWGRFPVGSWKQVRTTSQVLDDKGQVLSESITTTRTTLTAVEVDSYTLQTEVTVEVASRWISGLPQSTRHGYYGESPPQPVSVRRLPDAPLTIDGRTVNCQVRQVVLPSEGGKLVQTLYLSDQTPPFILRRESSLENGNNNDEKRRTALVEVLAFELPFRVGDELCTASLIKTTQYLARGTRTTFEMHCPKVPGGVAAHWATETNAAGRVMRRSTLELIAFGVPSEEEDVAPAAFRRHRPGKGVRRVEGR